MMFPLRQIHQIEVTSECNLACRYCAHPKMPRAKMHMDVETFVKALGWVKIFRNRLSGEERKAVQLNLAGIGESTLHPHLIDFLAMARESLGGWQDHDLTMATNGVTMTDELARELRKNFVRVWVSAHRPEVAGPAVEALRRAGCYAGSSSDPTVAAINWAGQVKWHVSAPRNPCPWVRGGWAMVMSDGRLTRCCLDSTGAGVLRHPSEDRDLSLDDDLLTQAFTSPYRLCVTCHDDVGVPMTASAEFHPAATSLSSAAGAAEAVA